MYSVYVLKYFLATCQQLAFLFIDVCVIRKFKYVFPLVLHEKISFLSSLCSDSVHVGAVKTELYTTYNFLHSNLYMLSDRPSLAQVTQLRINQSHLNHWKFTLNFNWKFYCLLIHTIMQYFRRLWIFELRICKCWQYYNSIFYRGTFI